MKIGLVLPSIPAYSEAFFKNKIKGLESNGYKVVLFVNQNSKGIKTEYNVKIAPKVTGNFVVVFLTSFFILLKVFILHYQAVKKLFYLNKRDGMRLVANLKNCIINSHFLSEKLDWLHFGFGTMALERENVASAIGAKMGVSFRGFDIGIYPIKHKNCYSSLWKKVDKIHVISDDIKELVLKNGFTNFQKIIKICPAINLDFFKNTGILEKKEVIQIATIGRLHWKKGLEYTLEALNLVKQKGIDFEYTIIGSGPEKERLQFAVHQLGLQENVIFTGKLSPEEVKNQLQKCDIYIQYSIQEGFCNAVLEAQAMGKICIVSDAEGLSENVINNRTGFVVPKRNPLSLATSIIAVNELSNEQKEIISQAAINRVKNEFTIENQIAKFINFYEEN